jgi:transcriptional regulator with XRE-family HTH domain
MGAAVAFGRELRRWRRSVGLSQLRLAVEAGVSARHLSFIETGRAQPSRELVLRLAAQLRLPAGEQSALLLAAGFAPLSAARPLDAPDVNAVRAAAAVVLAGHEPYPAIALDRRLNVVMANRAAPVLLGEVAPALRGPPLNIARVLLHPEGLAPRIVNFAAYAAHLVARLRRDAEALGDPALFALLAEVAAYPGVDACARAPAAEVALSLRLRDDGGELAFIPTLAGLGAPFEIATTALVVEALLPANDRTARRVRALSGEAALTC